MKENTTFNVKILKAFQAIESLNIINPSDNWEQLYLNKIGQYINKQKKFYDEKGNQRFFANKCYRWYFGIFKEQYCYDILHKFFHNGEEPISYSKKTTDTFLFSFDTDNAGKVIDMTIKFQEVINLLIFLMNDYNLKQYLEARYLDTHPVELNFINKKIKDIKNSLDEHFKDKTVMEIIDTIEELINNILQKLHLSFKRNDDNKQISIKLEKHIYVVPYELKDSNSQIQNFYINDINFALEEAQKNKLNNNLKIYLTGNNPNIKENQQDFNDNQQLIEKILKINNWSNAKWPSSFKHNLSLMQQVAVNQIINNNGETLIAVNGPPGTGKTTLLKDIFADNLVKRAEVLATYTNVNDAFQIENPKNTVRYYLLKPELHNFLMVVASNNNNAVENISVELPTKGSLDYKTYGQELKEIDYFSNLTIPFLNKDYDEKETKQIQVENLVKGWGLFSAPMGSRKKRDKVLNTLLYGSQSYNIGSLEDQLTNCPEIQWNKAKEEFNSALSAVKYQKIKLINFIKKYHELQKLESLILENKIEYENLENKKNLENDLFSETSKKLKIVQYKLNGIPKKASLWKRFFSKKIRIKTEQQEKNKQYLTDDLTILKHNYSIHKENLNLLNKKINEFQYKINLKDKMIKELNQIEKSFKNFEFDAEKYFNYSKQDKNFKCLFFEEGLAKLRIKCFLAALKLHKAFQQGCKNKLVQNIKKLRKVFNNTTQVTEKEYLALLSSLQIIVPVISTTLASFYNMFGKLPNSSINYVIIDEAAQAMPHMAIGALRKSKNFVSVGDPMQIRPIISPSENLVKEIGKMFQIEEPYINDNTIIASIQKVSEHTSKYGSWIPNTDGNEIRVGIPLLAHRRCANPMFKISNKLAYNNEMILHDSLLEKSKTNLKSVWINDDNLVTYPEIEKHVVLNQIQLVEKIIKTIKNNSKLKNNDIAIISPFKDIVLHLENKYWKYFKENKIDCGTNYSFQGKQTHIVIFVLGCDIKTLSSIRWLCSQVNDLNVAVSRAQTTFITIGNYLFAEKQPLLKIIYDNVQLHNLEEYLKIIETH